MDEKRPKRRKDKYNPYTISKKGGRYFLSFKDGQGVPHNYKIDRPLFDLFDSFELEDKSYLNIFDRYIEQSELTEASLNKRAFQKPTSIEDLVINTLQKEMLINYIEVSEQFDVDGYRQQNITIKYNFVGKLPENPINMEFSA